MHNILSAPQQIAALVPAYTDMGDVTRILTTAGTQHILPLQPRTILHRLARSRAIDLKACKLPSDSCGIKRRSILQPLPLAAGVVFFPVKVRTPRVARDTCTGYVNCYAVDKLRPGNAVGTRICLSGGLELMSLWSPETTSRYYQNARLAAQAAAHRLSPITSTSPGELDDILRKLVEACQLILHLRTHGL